MMPHGLLRCAFSTSKVRIQGKGGLKSKGGHTFHAGPAVL